MTVSARLKSFLDENKTPHTVMSHAVAYTAQAAAAVMHVSGKEVAKTVVVRAGETTALAVLPAACHVNLDRLGQLLGNPVRLATEQEFRDRKSTRLNSSHRCISYAVFCLKKKNNHSEET